MSEMNLTIDDSDHGPETSEWRLRMEDLSPELQQQRSWLFLRPVCQTNLDRENELYISTTRWSEQMKEEFRFTR